MPPWDRRRKRVVAAVVVVVDVAVAPTQTQRIQRVRLKGLEIQEN